MTIVRLRCRNEASTARGETIAGATVSGSVADALTGTLLAIRKVADVVGVMRGLDGLL